MQTTIDAAGRVVIPKAIRDALGLGAGAPVDISIDGVSIRIDGAARTGESGVRKVKGLLVFDPAGPVEPLTDDMVEAVRDDIRAERVRG